MAKKSQQIERNPFVMFVAVIIWLAGMASVVLGGMMFEDSAVWGVLFIAGGFSSIGLSTLTLITGKPEWILVDLILPG